jgi:CheY-like chemotaxis protein
MSTPTDSSIRFEIFEPGDKTALVCMDVPEMERLVVEQIRDLGYKVHTVFSVEDFTHKLHTHHYDVVVIAENYAASTLHSNPLLAEAVNAPAAQRQRQVVVLIGASLKTADEMQAFQHSVDLVVSLTDIANLRPIVRRSANFAHDFYARYLEAVAVDDVA